MIATITLNPSIDRRYNITKLKANTVQRTDDYLATAGGKGINVSKVIHLLDKKVVASGFLGGYSGNFIKKRLNELNIKDNFINIDGTTRSCLNIIDKNQNSIEILENGPRINKREKLKFLKEYKDKIKKYEVITISGSLPDGIENDFYQKLVKLAKEKNKIVILDSSGKALMNGIEAGPDIIKPNKSEVEEIVDFSLIEENDFLKAGKILRKKGAKNIAITLGKKGMYYITKNSTYKVKVPEIEALNVTGSGDSVVAGLAVAVEQEMSDKKMLKFANACGVANAVEKKTGFIDQSKVVDYSDKIEVNKI